MKKYILILGIVMTGNFVFGGDQHTGENRNENGGADLSGMVHGIQLRHGSTIDVNDTVVFDLAHSVITGNQVAIPVSILSDDTIYSLDFSIKYNQSHLIYDSVVNHTGYIQAFAFYNINDSTLRFTSNSLQEYGNDTQLVSIYFSTISGPLNLTDFDTINAYLNGVQCSIKLTSILTTGIPDTKNNDVISVDVYPNPAIGKLNVSVDKNAIVVLFDMNGRQIYREIIDSENHKQEIDIEGVISGFYFLKVFNDEFVSIKKVMIQGR